jgi:hypothetical protein
VLWGTVIGLGLMRSEWNWRDTRGGGNRAAREIGGISAKKCDIFVMSVPPLENRGSRTCV